jgi:peroxiredoxin Q/BCP
VNEKGIDMNQPTDKQAVGKIAPDFSLRDATGHTWQLSALRGQVVTLLFYPGDETLICTRQLCSVRDHWQAYLTSGSQVLAISPDSPDTHKHFASHHNLPMPLLSDSHRQITQLYSSHSWFPIWSTRAVVIIDAKGIIRYHSVMLRVFRPTDEAVLSAIHLAQYDLMLDHRTQNITSDTPLKAETNNPARNIVSSKRDITKN